MEQGVRYAVAKYALGGRIVPICIFSRRATFTTSAISILLLPATGGFVFMILSHHGDRTDKCTYIFSELASHSWAGKSLEVCLMALMADRPMGKDNRKKEYMVEKTFMTTTWRATKEILVNG